MLLRSGLPDVTGVYFIIADAHCYCGNLKVWVLVHVCLLLGHLYLSARTFKLGSGSAENFRHDKVNIYKIKSNKLWD